MGAQACQLCERLAVPRVLHTELCSHPSRSFHPASAKMGGCAVFCMINSAVGVPFLCFLGFICSQKSPMIEAIPDDQKEEAGVGCYIAAVMYMVTFVMAYVSQKKEKKASAREVEKEGTLL